MKQKNIKGLISEYFIFLIFIALVVVLTCLKPSFIAPTNLVNILKQASINGILAFGMMFVIIAGGFDMSVGSTVAFTGILAALLGIGLAFFCFRFVADGDDWASYPYNRHLYNNQGVLKGGTIRGRRACL